MTTSERLAAVQEHLQAILTEHSLRDISLVARPLEHLCILMRRAQVDSATCNHLTAESKLADWQAESPLQPISELAPDPNLLLPRRCKRYDWTPLETAGNSVFFPIQIQDYEAFKKRLAIFRVAALKTALRRGWKIQTRTNFIPGSPHNGLHVTRIA